MCVRSAAAARYGWQHPLEGNNVRISGKIYLFYFTRLYIYMKGNKIYIEKKERSVILQEKNQN
jgi:hypothetical protein